MFWIILYCVFSVFLVCVVGGYASATKVKYEPPEMLVTALFWPILLLMGIGESIGHWIAKK